MTTILLLTLIQNIGLSLAVGSATYALIFYFRAIEAGGIEMSERRFLNIVYLVLRIGTALVVFSELALAGLFWWQGDTSIFFDETFWFRWTILGAVIVNSVLMALRGMPMALGQALAVGSWYMYLIATTLAVLQPPYVLWLVFYALFIAAFAIFLKLAHSTHVETTQ